MAKPRKSQDEKDLEKSIELLPNAWARFERFVQDIAKAGPQHRQPHKPREESKTGKAARKDRAAKPSKQRG